MGDGGKKGGPGEGTPDEAVEVFAPLPDAETATPLFDSLPTDGEAVALFSGRNTSRFVGGIGFADDPDDRLADPGGDMRIARSPKRKNGLPPFWTKVGRVQGKQSRVAGLDIHAVETLPVDREKMGAGDFDDLMNLIDTAAEAGLKMTVVNPFNDSGEESCPYCAVGLLSCDPAHLSEEQIMEGMSDWPPEIAERLRSLLDFRGREKQREDPTRFDHNAVRHFKLDLLRLLFEKYRNDRTGKSPDLDDDLFERYKETCSKGTFDYAVFMALKKKFRNQPWYTWPEEFKQGDAERIYQDNEDIREDTDFALFTQYIADRQLQGVADHAAEKGVYLVMDKPIYPQADSADVWANQDLFYLDRNGQPEVVSGCNIAGDPFGAQKWGHAVYKFRENPEGVIDFFVGTIRHMAKTTKVIRLDHALALIWKYYTIPRDESGENGKYREALKHKLFVRLRREFPDVYFYAEDVGYTSEEDVDSPLRENGVPGMRAPILRVTDERYGQIGDWPEFAVAMTDTHDTEAVTTWISGLDPKEKAILFPDIDKRRLEEMFPHELAMEYLRRVFASRAMMAIVSARTLTGDDRRYNLPGTSSRDNWSVVLQKGLDGPMMKTLGTIIERTGRKARTISKAESPEVFAMSPGDTEVTRLHKGQKMRFDVATNVPPVSFEIQTNAPFNADGRDWTDLGEGWRSVPIPTNFYGATSTEYDDGTVVTTFELPALVNGASGRYEYAVTVHFGDGTTAHLCNPGQNFILETM